MMMSSSSSSSSSSPHSSDDDSCSVVSVDEVEGPFHAKLLVGYWGQRPLLIRKAFDAPTLISEGIWPCWNEMVDLASCCPQYDDDDGVLFTSGESARLIQHIPGKLDSFTLDVGPFEKEYIDTIMLGMNRDDDDDGHDDESIKWTLLVNDVDRYMPPLSDWIQEQFGFLPRWRRDDAQVSIAHAGGGIGPHVDNYDVFLAQGLGQRSWQLGSSITVATEIDSLIPDLSVRILNHTIISGEKNNFAELLLAPGDVLYLPPRAIHWGTAQSMDCMTISIGCRAPSASDLVARIAEELSDSVTSTATARYRDPISLLLLPRNKKRREQEGPPSITPQIRSDTKQLVWNAIRAVLDDDHVWDEILGKAVTEPIRFSDGAVRPYRDIIDDDFLDSWGKSPSSVLKRIQNGRGFLMCPAGVSFATSQVHTVHQQQEPKPNDVKDIIESRRQEQPHVSNRLYAHGQMWQVVDNDPGKLFVSEQVFSRIEQGQCIQKQHLEGASKDLLRVLKRLIAEGMLIPANKQ